MSKKRNQTRPPHARAEQNRKIRQEALRESLAASGLIEQIGKDIDNLDKLRRSAQRAKPENLERIRVQNQVIKNQIDARFKKLNKVLPDLKSQEGTLDVNVHDPAQTLEEAHERAREARIRREQERASNGNSSSRSPESGSVH